MKSMKIWGIVFIAIMAMLWNNPSSYAECEEANEPFLAQGSDQCLVDPSALHSVESASAPSHQEQPSDPSLIQPLDIPANPLADASPLPEVSAPETSVVSTDGFLRYDVPLSEQLQRYTYDLSKTYGIDYELVLAVMYVESNFKANNRSRNTNGTVDSGLMQVNSAYRKWQADIAEIPLHEYDVLDPHHNIRVGIAELAYVRSHWTQQGISGEKLDTYMLNSYNMGIGGYTRFLKSGKVNRSYDQKVIKYMNDVLNPMGKRV